MLMSTCHISNMPMSSCPCLHIAADMMRNSPYWESSAVGIIARLAWKNIGAIDWEDELPLMFTKAGGGGLGRAEPPPGK